MSPTLRKLSVAGLILLAAIGYLVYAGIKAGRSYCLPVDTFVANPKYHSQRLLVYGTVEAEGLTVDSQTNSATFLLIGDERTVKVEYQGLIPDMFQAGGEVIVRGKMGEDGVFRADELLTKCPSKYQEQADQPGRSR